MSMLTLIAASLIAPRNVEVPKFPREFRAVWVATVANIDWPSKPGIPTDQAKKEALAILDKCKEVGMNAVIWQVRPSCDALYASKLEPWSEFLTGKQGRAPNPYWDPLEFLVKEAHRRGLELHCWFNPYRARHPKQESLCTMDHISNAKPNIVKKYGDYLWMDPGEKETQQHSLAVMLDVVKRYDVDGIHIDDYFYPYKEYAKGADFPDDSSYNKYRAAGGKLSRGDWRRDNVNSFVEDLNAGIHKIKPWVKFGISPFGIYRPGYPSSIKAGVDQYAELYADALKWFQRGWCDYLTPQLYWPIKQTAQSYPVLLRWWAEQNKAGRNLWPGNFTSRTSPEEGNWPASEVADQVQATRDQVGATGNVHFSMKALMKNWNGVTTALDKLYAQSALVPASPWLASGSVPQKPNLRATGDKSGGVVSYFWSPAGGGDNLRWVSVYSQVAGKWSRRLFDSAEPVVTAPADATAVAVTVVDKVGNESDATAGSTSYTVSMQK